MPASNHDLSAAVVDGFLYVAGGSTEDWGPTRVSHAFDEIWRLDPANWTWSTVAKFDRTRIYCGTVAFAGKVWVVGGDTQPAVGPRSPVATVEIFDPSSGALTRGPDLPEALPAPLALVAGERLYVIGSAGRKAPGRVFSLGYREKAWRREPDGPAQMWALAGASLGGKLYVCVPSTGLVEFNPANGRWTTIPGPTKPRSAQVAAWRGEIWIMGGRDIREQAETRIFNPVARTWRMGPTLPRPLSWGAAGVVADRLIVTGGSTAKVNGFDYSDLTFALRADFTPAPPAATTFAVPPAWDDTRLVGTGGNTLPTTTVQVFPELKFQRPVTIMSVPVKDPATELERLLVIESDGPISTFTNRPDVRSADVMLDLPARFKKSTQTYGLAFHPRFPAVPHVYVVYNHQLPKPAENVLARFTVTEFSPPRIDPASERVLMRWPSDGHNGGDVKFGPDGCLYVSTGDGGSPGDPRNVGQRVDIVTGGILRLDIERAADGKNYAVPPDNPFVGLPNVLPEYWAYGLRNPWRMSFAPTGELWVGDNGDDSWESVHLIRKGANYGWSVFEGSHPFKRTLKLGGPNPHATPPIIELSHAEARSVIGGLVYRGKNIPSLTGHYVFGDYVTGAMWSFLWDGTAAQNFQRIAETRGRPIGFGEERSGELLMVRLDGQIHRLVPAPSTPPNTAAMPARLSETGLFAATASLTPAPGVLPYEINAPLWSDGAEAQRHIALPAGVRMTYAETKSWLLPDGTAVVRTLELPAPDGPRRVETQVMRRERGNWNFYTYAWNAAQSDAELVASAGETRAIPGMSASTWNYASRSECTVCHTAQTDFVLGLTTAQLNRDADFGAQGGGVAPQIATLVKLDRLDKPPAAASPTLSQLANPSDSQAPLDLRARSYLSVNCAHCHRAGGVGGRAEFQLLESLPLAKTGLINGRPLVPLLGPESRLVVPGHPERSEIFHRISLKEGGRMPLLGSQVPDADGIELIREWIATMNQPPGQTVPRAKSP
jgi:uncharacterized repeat protein (TIGR03806 family)